MYVMDYSSLALKPIALGLFLVQSSTVMFVLLLSVSNHFLLLSVSNHFFAHLTHAARSAPDASPVR